MPLITYTINPLETDEINNELTYYNLIVEPVLMDSSAILSNFYNTNSYTTLGTFNSIGTYINQGNSNLVNSILAALNPNTNIENNNKLFYNLYNAYLINNTLSNGDNLALFILAHQCPFTDGPIVYQARSLYNMVTEKAETYTDTYCEQLGFSFRGSESGDAIDKTIETSDIELRNLLINNEKTTQNKFKRLSIYDIYPNPASNQFNIISNIASEKLEVRVEDVNGKLLLKKKFTTANYSYGLDVDLLNGIYFVYLINEKGEKTVKKLIISKN